jgi:uncharacterized membrane protein YfcA
MELFTAGLGPATLLLAIAIVLVAGFVKGAVGFAMPMIMISGLGSILAPELALAALIVPTVLTNLWQASRGGLAATVAAMRHHWVFLAIALIFIALSAQLIRVLPVSVLFLIIGVPITLFALAQLLGLRLRFRPEHRRLVEVLTASVAGFIGGLSGVWGPPTVAYLTALDTPRNEQMRVQGVIYGLGAVVLFFAHLRSGVLNTETAPFSVLMTVPALIGAAVGFRFGDRLDQEKFRKATLAVLAIAGLNLIRRGLGP